MKIFTGQIAVVTGASSGVGMAIARQLASHGAGLCLAGRNRDKLGQIATEIQTPSAPVFTYQVDLARSESIAEFVSRLRQDGHRVDVLIHSAGVIARGAVANMPVEDFDWQYATNLRAPYFLTQQLLPLLRVHQGQIVFINSSAALNARAEVSQYAATKSALKAVADSIREEVNADGIRVLSVFLGRTATPMQAALYESERKPYAPELLLQPEDVAAVISHALSLPRTAEVTEISIRPLRKSY
jgi:NADP-dependent 3-hydroxy acid dehydrogenase YdfG